jgi:hypothetical protein
MDISPLFSLLSLFIILIVYASGTTAQLGILTQRHVHRVFYQQTFTLTQAEYCHHPAPLNWQASTCALIQR